MIAPRRKNVIYVTPDIERALGMIPQSHYRIFSSYSLFGKNIKEKYPDFVTLVNDSNAITDTPSLLKNKDLHSLAMNLEAGIVVFKNNGLIESISSENGLNLINPHATLAEKIENKVSQVEWLGSLAEKYLPPHKIKLGKELSWKNSPLIFQWAHGHTGENTILVRSEKDVQAIKSNFPERVGRVSSYIHGPAFTVNAVVTADKTLMGNISYQITGVSPFTDHEFSTIGNDWSVTHSLLSDKEIVFVESMVGEIGSKLHKDGWSGLFGIDFIRDDNFNRIFLIEINARQPASSVFESQLQQEVRRHGVSGLTTFEAHIHALTGEHISQHLIPINDGAQIIQRKTKLTSYLPLKVISELQSSGYTTISYENPKENGNILRIQSTRGIIESHNKFNTRGKEILKTLLS